MERITNSMIASKVASMQRQGHDVGLDGQYGKYRVTNKKGDTYLSERAPNREIYEWLFAYEKGYDVGVLAGRAEGHQDGYYNGVDDMRHGRVRES